jgi:AcrR family transcriptional regulator
VSDQKGQTMAQRAVRADARRNRARVLQVAAEAFATDGLGVSLDEIARRAGVGPGTLYRHFPTKQALFEAVVHQRLDDLVAAARALRHADDAGGALLAFIDRLVTEAGPKKDLIDALVGGGFDVHARLTGTTTQLRNELHHLLTRAQQQHTIRDDIAIADLMALISGILMALHVSRDHHTANPQRALAVLRDGLRIPDQQSAGQASWTGDSARRRSR